MSNIIEAALRLAAEGLSVFPCGSNKQAIVKWKEAATTDADRIRVMFGASSAVMIGVPTGYANGGIVAVDIDKDADPTKDGVAWFDANLAALGDTRMHSTKSGGYHLIYRMPDGVEIRNSASKLAPGVDIRGEGGYVVWPPSEGYSLANEADVAELPEFIVEALRKPVAAAPKTVTSSLEEKHEKYVQRAIDSELANVMRAANGTRNEALNKAAFALGQFVGAGMVTRSTIEAELTRAASGAGMDEREDGISATIKSGLEAGMRQPREMPESVKPEVTEEIHPAARLITKANIRAVTAGRSKVFPPGIMELDGALKLLVDHIVSTAISPQPFLALGAALAAIGALAGRKYASQSDLRTNVFAILLGNSSSGKDHARKCVKHLFDVAGLGAYLGGEDFTAGQSIYGMLEVFPSRVCLLDEYGQMVAGMTSRKASSHKAEILPTLTKLFTSASEMVLGKEFAHQIGKEGKKRIDYYQPHVCIVGTTVSEVLWKALATGAIGDGSLARNLVFQTPENVPDRNKRPPSIKNVAPELIETLQAIASGVPEHDYGGDIAGLMTINAPMVPYIVPEAPEASAALDLLSDQMTGWMRRLDENSLPGDAFVGRWHEHTVTAAMIRAIGRNPIAPAIELADFLWAKTLTEHCIRTAMRETESHVADTAVESNIKRFLEKVRKAGREITGKELLRMTRFLNDRERKEIIAATKETGDLVIRIEKTNGPDRTWYSAGLPLSATHLGVGAEVGAE